MREGYQLIICGSRGDAAEETRVACERTPGVRLLGYVDDAQLRWLYGNALAFVLPSRLEGFGMPALEAARHGLPPIISRNSALNEAVGGLGIAVDWNSVDSIAQAMVSMTQMPAEALQRLKQALVAHASQQTREQFLARWRALLTSELNKA